MRNKTLLRVVQVLSLIFAMALLPAAHAVQVITMNVPDCPSGQAFTFSNNTLGCTGTPSPVPASCSVSSVPTAATQSGVGVNAGTSVTLTASCATGTTPITYTWNNLGGIQQSAVTITAPSATTSYTVTPSNSAGTGATFSTTVYIAGAQGVAPSNCSIAQSPNTTVSPVAAGTNVTLTATCASGSPVTSCAWSNNVPATTSCSVNVAAPAASTSYSVTASNSFGPAPSASTTIQIQVPPPSGGTSRNYCTGSDQIILVAWPFDGQTRPGTNGFGNQKIAFKITVPANITTSANINHVGFAKISESPGSPVTSRDLTVSKHSCDFESGDYLYNANGTGNTAPSAFFTTNNLDYRLQGAQFNAQSGDTFYVNVRNANNGNPSCGYSSCNVYLDFATPQGY